MADRFSTDMGSSALSKSDDAPVKTWSQMGPAAAAHQKLERRPNARRWK